MGRKVHPEGFRLGIIKDWKARWFAEGREYALLLKEDLTIRDLIQKELSRAGISKIEIERFPNQVSLTIHAARPGIVIGRKGSTVNALRHQLEELTDKKIRIEVQEVEHPEIDAHLIAESLAAQLSKRISHKRAMKQAVARAMRLGVEGVKIACAGRLSGAEMGRREWVMEGRVPLHTIRADIDYAQDEALTTLGMIGIKVWVNKGEVLPEAPRKEPEPC
ncbi:MAG: 30S ribosomal protein S3 [Anaerolineae bacterium]|nr:30S ribosomal protein S3 [Anaerolineae bacterium]